MGIGFKADFDALLCLAQAKHEEYERAMQLYQCTYVAKPEVLGYPDNVKSILHAAREKWDGWIKKNIKGRGLDLEADMLGRPVGISAVLAGERGERQ